MEQLDVKAVLGRVRPARPWLMGHVEAELRSTAQKSLKRQRVTRALARHMEGLRLVRPLPHLEPFHASTSPWRVIDGSNRSSKTMSACIELCRCLLGCDPYHKYIPKGGNAIVVGMLLGHIEMIWRKCAMPGAFQIIRDEITHLYRAVRPDPNDPSRLDPYDDAYREKWREAPPLIPKRMIVGRPAWEDKAKGIPTFVQFGTGWRLHFYSSKSVPPQGDHYHFALIDEELLNPMFLVEIKRGLVALDEPEDQRPRAVWSATAQTTNPELLQMREQSDAGSTRVQAFKALIKDNPYVPDEEKQAFYDSLSEDERRVRFHGEYALAGMRCYPTFDPQVVHGYEPFEIPPQWCRWIALDPGTRHCGTLFAAVDPDEKHVWIYDGFDLRNGDPASWADRIAQRGETFEGCVIDARAGKQRPMGASVNVAQSYKDALDAAGVEFRQSGPMNGFFPGSEDIPARQVALQTWLTVRQHGPFAGTPRLLVARGRIPHLEDQIRYAHMDMRNPDRRAKPQWDRFHEDMVVCAEYLAAFNPRYFDPQQRTEPDHSEVVELFKQMQRRTSRHRATSVSPTATMLEMG